MNLLLWFNNLLRAFNRFENIWQQYTNQQYTIRFLSIQSTLKSANHSSPFHINIFFPFLYWKLLRSIFTFCFEFIIIIRIRASNISIFIEHFSSALFICHIVAVESWCFVICYKYFFLSTFMVATSIKWFNRSVIRMDAKEL